MSWSEFCHARLLGFVERPRFDKLETRRVVEACGYRCSKVLRVFDRAAELDFDGLPDAFVLKPSTLAAKRGVMLLQRSVSGRQFRELFRRRYLTLDEIKAEQAAWQSLWGERGMGPCRLFAEEWVVGENGPGQIPFDYKLFTFGDTVKLIAQCDRNVVPAELAFFLDEFEPFDGTGRIVSSWKRMRRGVPHVPKCSEELIAAAKAISTYLRTGFISIDAYATPDGPVIGELTPVSGAAYYGQIFAFTPEFDAELGRCWREANRTFGLPIPEIAESDFNWRKRPRMPSRLPAGSKRSAASGGLN
ncbi:MAG: ATP-grasp fold amidoligase family protein [Methyloceanibacter sp.]